MEYGTRRRYSFVGDARRGVGSDILGKLGRAAGGKLGLVATLYRRDCRRHSSVTRRRTPSRSSSHAKTGWMSRFRSPSGRRRQIVLLVAPVLVLLGALLGQPMNLVFTTLELVATVLAVVIVNFVVQDGESNWLEGLQLLAAYAIMAIAFFLHAVAATALFEENNIMPFCASGIGSSPRSSDSADGRSQPCLRRICRLVFAAIGFGPSGRCSSWRRDRFGLSPKIWLVARSAVCTRRAAVFRVGTGIRID